MSGTSGIFSTESVFKDFTPEQLLNTSEEVEQFEEPSFGNTEAQTPYDDSLTLHEKRKAADQEARDGNIKSAKSVIGSKNAGKKPGRKLDTSEPASKRKAQNRAAQRAFRERKEQHLKELEDKVDQLEAEAAATNNENEFLKVQVERLQTELKKYRGSGGNGDSQSTKDEVPQRPFTFEFPFFQPKKTEHKPSLQSSSSRTSQSGDSPRFSVGSASSNSSSPFTNLTNSTSSTPCTKDHNTGGNEEDTFCDQLQLACGCSENPIPQAPVENETKTKSSTPQIAPGSLNQSKSPAKNDSTEASLFSPPPLDFDFLGSYRDPLFETQDFQLPELETTEYSAFDAVENPIVNQSFNSMSDMINTESATEEQPSNRNQNQDQKDDAVVPAYNGKLMSCSAVWDRVSAHPKFNDFDIDGLCTELRRKAKCSETGVMVTEKDVDNVLANLG